MSLTQWVSYGWLRPHQTSAREILNLFRIVDRDLRDAAKGSLSDDWRFGIAYNAALKLCTILLYAQGFRPEKNLAHYRTLQALPLILGEKHKEETNYLDTCRNKRNRIEYDSVGAVTAEDAAELIAYVNDLRATVLEWLKNVHPKLSPEL